MRSHRLLLIAASFGFALGGTIHAADPNTPKRPNVLFIMVDDLNHWVGYLGRNKQKELAAFLPKENKPAIGASAAGAEEGEGGENRAAKAAARKARKEKK